MKRNFWMVLVTVVCLALFALFAIGSMDEPKQKTEKSGAAEELVPEEEVIEEEDYVSNEPVAAESVTDAIKITGNALFSAYATDAVAADKKYYGKYLDVEGTVKGLTKDVFEKYVLEINSGSEAGCVQCYLEPKYIKQAKTLKVGQAVRVRGQCDGFANSKYVMLKGSIILP